MKNENGFFHRINPFKKDGIESLDSRSLKNQREAKKLLDQAQQFATRGNETKLKSFIGKQLENNLAYCCIIQAL